MNPPQEELSKSGLGEEPTRDARFVVADRWVDCVNFPGGHPLRELEFFHRQMNEEIDALESCARNIVDFPQEDWEVRLGLARQCSDEARHAALFRRIFEGRGGRIGQYPVLNFQYRIITNISSLVGRMAVQNRSFEAGGLDAISVGIEDARQKRDDELADLLETQHADEIAHVRFANDWIRRKIAQDPRSVLQMGVAMAAASKAFMYVMGPEGTSGVKHPADVDGRHEAGFTESEVRVAIDLQRQPAR